MKIYIDDLHKIMPGNAFFSSSKRKGLKNLSYFLDVVKTDTKLALFHFFFKNVFPVVALNEIDIL